MLLPSKSVRALALSALLCWPPAGGAQDALPAAVDRVLAHYGIPRENYSVWVRDMGEDQPLLSHHADVPRKPASVIKLLTGWLAGILNVDFQVDGFGAAFLGAIVISFVSFLLSLFISAEKDDKD